MDKSEIVRNYREEKNKATQIQILADLNCTDAETIKKILTEAGEYVEKKKPGQKPKTVRQIVVKPLPDCVKKAITERMIMLILTVWGQFDDSTTRFWICHHKTTLA